MNKVTELKSAFGLSDEEAAAAIGLSVDAFKSLSKKKDVNLPESVALVVDLVTAGFKSKPELVGAFTKTGRFATFTADTFSVEPKAALKSLTTERVKDEVMAACHISADEFEHVKTGSSDNLQAELLARAIVALPALAPLLRQADVNQTLRLIERDPEHRILPDDTPLVGADLQRFKDRYELKVVDMIWLLYINSTDWGKLTASKQPLPETIELILRVLDRYPQLSPFASSEPTATEVHQMLGCQIRQLSLLMGRQSVAGNRWLKKESFTQKARKEGISQDDAKYGQRMVPQVIRLLAMVKSLAEDGRASEYMEMVRQAGRNRGIEDVLESNLGWRTQHSLVQIRIAGLASEARREMARGTEVLVKDIPMSVSGSDKPQSVEVPLKEQLKLSESWLGAFAKSETLKEEITKTSNALSRLKKRARTPVGKIEETESQLAEQETLLKSLAASMISDRQAIESLIGRCLSDS